MCLDISRLILYFIWRICRCCRCLLSSLNFSPFKILPLNSKILWYLNSLSLLENVIDNWVYASQYTYHPTLRNTSIKHQLFRLIISESDHMDLFETNILIYHWYKGGCQAVSLVCRVKSIAAPRSYKQPEFKFQSNWFSSFCDGWNKHQLRIGINTID